MFRRRDYQQEFEQVLRSDGLRRLFELNGGQEIPVIHGHKVTRHETEFRKGTGWGLTAEYSGLMTIFAGTPYIDRNGTYIVKADLETYDLILTNEGLRHQIMHEHRCGQWHASGPGDEDFIHDEILDPGFPDAGHLHFGYGPTLRRYPHDDLDTQLDAIVYQSGLSARRIVNHLIKVRNKDLKGKKVKPINAKSFTELGILDFEPGHETSIIPKGATGTWK